MTFDEALRFWYSRVDFERTRARPSDLKLEHMRDLLGRLGDPQKKLRVVHIAGSKGKGSTAAMFAAVGSAAGLTTGLFTSPHLVDVSERIQVNGQAISRSEIALLLSEMHPYVEHMEASGFALTFFEIATALAYLHFCRRAVDLAIVEVGLGGRFDATNVCTPVLTVITSISLEHTAILGNTVAQIAFEKAGIIKPGCPIVCGVDAIESFSVIHTIASEQGAELLTVGRDFDFQRTPGRVSQFGGVTPQQVTISFREKAWSNCELNLLGAHQAANAALVAVGCAVLEQYGIAISDQAVRTGLMNVHWPARLQVFPGTPVVVLDCAHNPASAKTMMNSLAESFTSNHPTLVFACSSDKDVDGMLAVLAEHFDRFIFTRFQLNPRSIAPEILVQSLRSIRPAAEATIVANPIEAVATARTGATDLVVIAGSTYLAGEVLPVL